MKKLILGLAAMALSSVAMAGPAWTYAEAAAIFVESGDDKTTGYGIGGSLGLGDLFHVTGQYEDYSDGEFDGGISDYDGYRIAAGIHPAVTDSTDIFAELGYTSVGIDDANNDPDAIDLTLGVRSMVSDKVELSAALKLNNGSDDTGGSDDFQSSEISIGGQYFFTDAFSITASGSEDVTALGVRWSFGGGLFQ